MFWIPTPTMEGSQSIYDNYLLLFGSLSVFHWFNLPKKRQLDSRYLKNVLLQLCRNYEFLLGHIERSVSMPGRLLQADQARLPFKTSKCGVVGTCSGITCWPWRTDIWHIVFTWNIKSLDGINITFLSFLIMSNMLIQISLKQNWHIYFVQYRYFQVNARTIRGLGHLLRS